MMIEQIKRWYQAKSLIMKLLIGLFIWPFIVTYLIMNTKGLSQERKLVYSGLFWVILIILAGVNQFFLSPKAASISPNTQVSNKAETSVPNVESSTSSLPPSPAIAQPSPLPATPKSSLEKIKEVANNATAGKAEVTVWSGDEFANEENKPYEVVINYSFDHSISSCQSAKSVSYEIMKALYSDADARKDLRRVLVTIPYYLRTSLGSSDGIPLAEKNSFTGPTNYWSVMSDPRFAGEHETGEPENRTWGYLFGKCE